MAVLVLAEHNNAALNDATAKTVAAAQAFGGDIDVLVAGHNAKARPTPPPSSLACAR